MNAGNLHGKFFVYLFLCTQSIIILNVIHVLCIILYMKEFRWYAGMKLMMVLVGRERVASALVSW